MAQRIVVVCNGNVHRSVLAEMFIRRHIEHRGIDSAYEVISRGVAGTCGMPGPPAPNIRDYPLVWRLTCLALAGEEVLIPQDKRSTPISREDVASAAIVLAMDRLVLEREPNGLYRQFPDLTGKMHLFSELEGRTDDIPDLFRKDDAALYVRVIGRIRDAVEQGFDELIRLAG